VRWKNSTSHGSSTLNRTSASGPRSLASLNSCQLPYDSGAGRDPTGGMEMPTCRASALRRLVNDTPKADSRANSPSRSDEIPLLKIKHLCLRSHLILSIDSQDLSQFGLLCPQQHQQVQLPTSILSASINYTSRCVGKLVCPRACCTSGRWGHIGATSGPRTTGPHIRDPIRSSTGPPMHVRRRFRACQREGPGRCRQQRRDLAGIGVRQSAGVSVDSNGACRGNSGGAAGRGASRWPSRPAWRSPAGRPAAARTRSPRGIPRAATTRIESTRWRRDQPEVSASTVEPGERKGAPHTRDAPRRWPCLGTLRRLHAGV
jgi:hypothetical protein